MIYGMSTGLEVFSMICHFIDTLIFQNYSATIMVLVCLVPNWLGTGSVTGCWKVRLPPPAFLCLKTQRPKIFWESIILAGGIPEQTPESSPYF